MLELYINNKLLRLSVGFPMFKYLCNNIVLYLTILDDPFSQLYGYSMNENGLSMEKLKLLYKKIVEILFND